MPALFHHWGSVYTGIAVGELAEVELSNQTQFGHAKHSHQPAGLLLLRYLNPGATW